MSDKNNSSAQASSNDSPSFIGRVVSNDSFRKGVATAIAGAIVSVVSEVMWPKG